MIMTNEHPQQRQTRPDSHFHNDDDAMETYERKLEKKGPTETTMALGLQVSFLN